MKCLSSESTCHWLADFGISIDQYRQLVFPFEQSSVQVSAPDLPVPMTFLAERLVEWIPKGTEYLIWFSNWEVAPATQVLLADQLRADCEDCRSLIESPGVLIDGSSLHEKTSASAMLFLLMAFKWDGYLLSKHSKSYLYFFDGFIKASYHNDIDKLQFLEISQAFSLEFR